MEQLADIGSFDRKVSFCVVTSGKTAMGGPAKTYAHSFYMSMSRQQLPSPEQYVNGRLVTPTRYLYKGHYKSSINETMQIVDATIKYNILSVNPLKGNVFVEITVEKITE